MSRVSMAMHIRPLKLGLISARPVLKNKLVFLSAAIGCQRGMFDIDGNFTQRIFRGLLL